MNEDYDKIAHLHESGLFSIEEIENVIEEGYKEIDKKKENKMYRRAGNLSREALSKGMSILRKVLRHRTSLVKL